LKRRGTVVARRIIISLVVVISVFSFNLAVAQTTIVGQNNPAIDVQAVQAAVDQGGTLLLKGTFDFGDKGRVNITKDVKIIGEKDSNGSLLTKIKGGFWTFHSPLPSQLPPGVPRPEITIQNIHFDGALWTPIHLAYCSGATITDNKIRNVKPVPVPGTPETNYQQGIICGTRYAQPRETRKYQPNAFTGPLTIADNDIDLTNDAPTKTMAQGAYVLWATGINAQIQRNTIINCTRNAIEIVDNYLGKDGSGMIFLKDNKIVTATEGIPAPTPQTPNGIMAGWFFDQSGALDPQRNVKHVIVNNGIRTRGKTSFGISVFTDGAVVVNNAIFTEGAEARSLSVRSSDGYFAFNRIEGSSNQPGILVGTWKPLKGSKNVFIDNDLSRFKGLTADVGFEKDVSNNLFIGPTCKVSDLGSNNLIQMTK
jgi:hypothetical protein